MTNVKDAIAQLDNQALKTLNNHLALKVTYVIAREIIKGVAVVVVSGYVAKLIKL